MISLAQVFHRSSGSSFPAGRMASARSYHVMASRREPYTCGPSPSPPPMELRLGAPLPHNPRIVCVFVRVAHPIDHLERLSYGAGEVFFKLFRQRQQQIHQRVVVVRFDGERIETDALGLGRLVEQPISLGLSRRRAPPPPARGS